MAPDEAITVETRLLKQGRTLAFLACDVRADDGDRLLLEGRHAKFLNLGFQHDLFIHSPLRRATLPLLEMLADRGPRHAYEGGAAGLTADDVFGFRADGSMDVTAAHCNGIGGLHGGAACMIAERAATRSRPDAGPPKSMNVTLMAALRAGAAAPTATTWPTATQARVTIADGATGLPCYDVAVGF